MTGISFFTPVTFKVTIKPSLATEWLALVLRIREVPGSSLGPETGYYYRGFSCIFSVRTGEFRDSALNLAPTN
jgi:hypothetical protein